MPEAVRTCPDSFPGASLDGAPGSLIGLDVTDRTVDHANRAASDRHHPFTAEHRWIRAYLFMTDAAATAIGSPLVGFAHREEYADAGPIQGRLMELGEQERGGVST